MLKFSFLIALYNGEDYLPSLLDSLLNQDIPYDEYEIICLDDEFFEEIPLFIKDQDYEMAFDALKGLYILAEQFRLMRLYEYLLEVV